MTTGQYRCYEFFYNMTAKFLSNHTIVQGKSCRHILSSVCHPYHSIVILQPFPSDQMGNRNRRPVAFHRIGSCCSARSDRALCREAEWSCPSRRCCSLCSPVRALPRGPTRMTLRNGTPKREAEVRGPQIEKSIVLYIFRKAKKRRKKRFSEHRNSSHFAQRDLLYLWKKNYDIFELINQDSL